MLIPSLLAFSCLLLKFFRVSASIQEQIIPPSKISKFNLLCSDLIIHIGRYLALPQRNLGFVNRDTYNALFKIYPLKYLINERLNIPELLKSENGSELIFFEKLMTVSDPLHLFYAIATGTFVQNAFPLNGRLLTCYISRTLPALIKEYNNDLDTDLTSTTNIAFNLLSYGDFDGLFALFNNIPKRFKNFFIHLDVFMNNEFIEKLMNYENGIEIYSKLLQFLDSIPAQAKFIACSILVKSVPEELFLSRLTYSKNLIIETFKILFFESSQTFYRDFVLFEVITRYLHYIKLNSENQEETDELNGIIDHFNLLNRIVFGPVDENIIFEIQRKEYSMKNLKEIAQVALISGQESLFQQIIKNHVSSLFEDEFGYETIQNVFILNAFSSLSMEEKMGAYNNFEFFNLVSSYYEPRTITQSSQISIDFKLKSEYNNLPIPKLFSYYYSVASESIDIDDLFTGLFSQLNHITHFELIELLSSVSYCPIFGQLIEDSYIVPIFTTFEVLDLISRFQDLRDLVTNSRIHFTTDADGFANLLEHPLKHMNLIINYVEFDDLLPLLVTRNQLRNFEDFLNKSIAEIFFQNILPNMSGEISRKLFFEFRIALNYWLEGPHKNQLLELNIPLFRRLLAKESSINDSKFLTENLIDE